MNKPRNVLTLATGKKLYVDMAVNLARSFWLWNKDSSIAFYLATDLPQHLPEGVKDYIKVIHLNPDELGKGFSPKLHLDKLAPNGQTLFIDSDCLVYGKLSRVFELFNGHDVSVVGGYISTGEWFGDVAFVCKKFNIERLSKFNGGIYYLERGQKATAVYETARNLEPQYDEIGFVRLRDRPNDEVLMALAMALHNQIPVNDDGTIMSDPLSCQAPYSTDIIKGNTKLVNPPAPDALHQSWYPFTQVTPLVVHFLGHHTADHQYQKDVYRLKKKGTNSLNFLAETYAIFFIELKQKAKLLFKNTFRKIYHTVFGFRRIPQSERI